MSVLNTSALAEQVYAILKRDIIRGRFQPGEKLDVLQLVNEFKVSRSPVKEAIQQLVHDGLLEIAPRVGTYVTQITDGDFLELIDARLLIELWAARKCVNSVGPSEIVHWRNIVSKMDLLLQVDPFPDELYMELDSEFHQSLVHWAGNSRVERMYNSLNVHVAFVRIKFKHSIKRTKERFGDHQRLCTALEKRDLSELLGILQLHIESLKDEIQFTEVDPSLAPSVFS